MKYLLYISALVLPLSNINAQILDWAYITDNYGFSIAYDIISDSNENVYMVGQFSVNSTINFDLKGGTYNVTNSSTKNSGFVAKYDQYQNIQWAFVLTSPNSTNNVYSIVNNITIDNENNIIVGGLFYGGSIDLNPLSTGPFSFINQIGSMDFFLAKYNPNGILLWGFNVGGSTDVMNINSIITDHESSVYIGGSAHCNCPTFGQPVDFDPGPSQSTMNPGSLIDGYIAKYDSSGNFQWLNRLQSTGNQSTLGLSYSFDTTIIAVGFFEDSLQLGNEQHYPNQSAWYDAFVTKINLNGQYVWSESFGGKVIDRAVAVDVDLNNNIYVAGEYSDSVDFNNSNDTNLLISLGVENHFVLTLTKDGDYKNVFGLNSDFQYLVSDICYDDDNNKIFTLGTTAGTIDLDPSPDSVLFGVIPTWNERASYVGIYDTIGNYISHIGIFGNSCPDPLFAYSIHLDNGDLYGCGMSECSNTIISTNSDSALLTNTFNSGDFFIFKTSPCIESNPPILTASSSLICPNESVTLYADSNELNNAEYWEWRKDSINGSIVGTGNSIITNPSDTTVYYVFGNGGCVLSKNPSMIQINVASSYNEENSYEICQGDSILINGIYRNNSGVYLDTFQTTYGCDSTIISSITVFNPVYGNSSFQNICANDSILIGGLYASTSGVYYDTLQTTLGCDSILPISLTVNQIPNVIIAPFSTDTICLTSSPVSLPSAVPTGGGYTGSGVGGGNFDPTIAGIGTHNIIYTYTDGNSCTNSDTTIVTVEICTSIDNVSTDYGIIIYPNPSTGQFTIEKPNDLNKTVQVKLLDATSKLILENVIQIGNQKIEIDIRNYSKGIYYLQLIVDDKIFVKQILKN